MNFQRRHFDPVGAGGIADDEDGSVTYRYGDVVHVFSENAVLSINVALATDRPLLVTGAPGSGKTTLARGAAAVLGWWYYQDVVTSRTEASDLEARYDSLQRLNDATDPQAALGPKALYVEPGPLWWAFDPEGAKVRGDRDGVARTADRARDPGAKGDTDSVVLLLDEIDKADPDVPNDLLEPFDVGSFTVRETRHVVQRRRRVLLMLTSNGERELPPAFLRRCVHLHLPEPSAERLAHIADQRFGAGSHPLHLAVAEELVRLRKIARKLGTREPSTAEFLDAVVACAELGVSARQGEAWPEVGLATIWKEGPWPDAQGD